MREQEEQRLRMEQLKAENEVKVAAELAEREKAKEQASKVEGMLEAKRAEMQRQLEEERRAAEDDRKRKQLEQEEALRREE